MMRKNISNQLSKQVIKKEEESVRYSEYKINPLILNSDNMQRKKPR